MTFPRFGVPGLLLFSNSAVVTLFHTLYLCEFDVDERVAKENVALLSAHSIDKLPIDLRRILLDLSWNFVDEDYKQLAFKHKLKC